MEKISIILPSYNVGQYIGKCIESLIKQSYKNIEIIVVNDGSQDNTLQVALEQSNKDSRVIIMDQENKGVSIARNNAINRCTGDYIIFVDPDDYVHQDFVKSLYERLIETDADMVICGHTKIYDNSAEIKSKVSKQIFKGHDILKQYFIGESTLTVLMCDKIFKANIIKENKIYCPEEVTSGQDQVFILEYLLYSKIVATIDNNYYYYYQRLGSKSKRYEYYIFERTILKLDYLQKLLKAKNLYTEFEDFFKIRLYMNLFSQGFLAYKYSDKNDFDKNFKRIKKDSINYIEKQVNSIFYDIIIGAKLNFKEKIACFIIYYLPLIFTQNLYRLYVRIDK